MASVESNIRRLDRQVDLFVSQVGAVLDTVTNQIERDLSRPGGASTKVVGQRLGGLEAELGAQGMNRVIDNLSANYGSILRDVQASLNDVGISSEFDSGERRQIATVISFDLDSIRASIREYANRVKSQVARASLSGERIDFTDIFERNRARLLRELETTLENALQGLRNGLVLGKSKKARVKRFKYVGPLDDKTRPFCRLHVGKVFTTDEIARMDNEQGLPVITNLGGWNCRHEWRPVKDN